MRIWIFILSFLFLSENVYAERWVCYDSNSKEITRTVEGDCLNLGLCSGFNNQGLQPNCFEASADEFIKAKESFVKFDPSVVSGNKVIDMTQEEADLKQKPEQDNQEARNNLIESIRSKLTDQGFTNEEIDFLLNNY